MSSITLQNSTTKSIQKRRKHNRRILNPTVAVVILSCILLFGRNQHSAHAVESPTGTGKASTAPFIRKKTPFAKQRTTMPTRSGKNYRGGSAAEPADGNAEGNSPSVEGTAELVTTVAATTTVPVTAETSEATKSSFSWKDARRTLFPIHGKDEVQKFFLIGMIKFFIIMALTLTRDTKDTLVVTQCGAEAIAFLKVSIGNKNCFVSKSSSPTMVLDEMAFPSFTSSICLPNNFLFHHSRTFNRSTVFSPLRQLSLPCIPKCRIY